MTEPIDFSEAKYEHPPAAPSPAVDATSAPAEGAPAVSDADAFAAAALAAQAAAAQAEALSDRGKWARLGRALGFGGVAALLSAIVWWAILAATDTEFGLLAIGVGMLVGRAVRFGSDGIGGKGYQALAVFLTWMGITLGYVPILAAQGDADVPLVVTYLFSAALAPFTPWLVLFSGEASAIMGLVIIGIGLFEAYRVNAAVSDTIVR